jgi:hypothetical protein
LTDKLKFLLPYIIIDSMKFGGRCPLNMSDGQETFLRMQVEYVCKKSLIVSDRDSIRKEFCGNICKNMLC